MNKTERMWQIYGDQATFHRLKHELGAAGGSSPGRANCAKSSNERAKS